MDSGTLKNKVAASIVAISSIHLLKVFVNTENVSPTYLKWYVIIHPTFVAMAAAPHFSAITITGAFGTAEALS